MLVHSSHNIVEDRISEDSGTKKPDTGIFPCQRIRKMLEDKEIRIAEELFIPDIELDQIQPASIDLRLGRYAYPVRSSFLPGAKNTVLEKMRQLDEHFDKFK